MGKKSKRPASSLGTYQFDLNTEEPYATARPKTGEYVTARPRMEEYVTARPRIPEYTAARPKRDFYRLNERIDAATKNAVFKNGPGFLENDFRENVAKYACAFINSAENGALMLGVEPGQGEVTGYYYSHHEEERMRRDIDAAMSDLQPAIRPGDCSVNFVPVYTSAGTQAIRDLYVIEVSVSGAQLGARDQLYETQQGVFLRGRDGALEGPLSANSIQEWTKRRYQQKLDKLRKHEDSLKHELASSQSGFREKEEELARRERAIHGLEAGQKQHHERVESLEARNKQLTQENLLLKNSDQTIRQEVSDVKRILLQMQHKRSSRTCVIS